MQLPEKTALVLGGGGAKGAYHVGALAALDELGVRPFGVYGTSIGAVNAAMYAQGSMDLAAELWENTRLSDLITPQSLSLAEDAENLFGHPERLMDFITRYAHLKGLDITPYAQLLQRYIREDDVRASEIDFGLVTTRFPTLAMVERRIAQIEEGSLHRWLLASSACFPIFPMTLIGEDRYIDGGFSDNAPVEMAVRAGAQHIIALDIGKHKAHDQYDRRPNVTYIRTSQPLGSLLDFSAERARRCRIIGYNDVMRAFGRMRGVRYAFDPEDALFLRARAQEFIVRLTQFESQLMPSNALTKRMDSAPLFALLEEELPEKADAVDYLLRACEICADVAGIDPAQVLTFQSLADGLRTQLPLDKAESMLGSLLGGRIGVLFASPQPDRKLVIACLYRLLERENIFSSLAMRTLSAFPREMLCAITLREIL